MAAGMLRSPQQLPLYGANKENPMRFRTTQLIATAAVCFEVPLHFAAARTAVVGAGMPSAVNLLCFWPTGEAGD